jgi:ribonucleoside-diphosphate reductase alpha chain
MPIVAQERPKITNGKTHHINSGCGEIGIVVNIVEGKVFEVFMETYKPGACMTCFAQALARSISLGLRAGVEITEYIKTLKGIRCNAPSLDEGLSISSCPDAMAQVLEMYVKES